jgi:cytidylate kinase
MYRAFALKAIQGRTALDHEAELIRLSHITSIELNPSPHGNRVLLDGQDVTSQLRTPQISEGASRVSVHGPIRAWMVALQQAMGRKLPAGTAGLVMEGRDIGTVVFPEASIKVFLSASAEARTQRRLAQSATQPEIQPPIQSQIQTQTGSRARPSDVPLSPAADPIAVLAAMRERDTRDQTRSESPLRPAEDAILIDSTHLGLEDVVAQVGSLVVSRWGL